MFFIVNYELRIRNYELYITNYESFSVLFAIGNYKFLIESAKIFKSLEFWYVKRLNRPEEMAHWFTEYPIQKVKMVFPNSKEVFSQVVVRHWFSGTAFLYVKWHNPKTFIPY
ncbi:hypothetical protein [Marinifilum sp.]|uniref:hypothetical protein n=1 Tax=Marinifilum sp. TaxID=2033137 RepID=UPI003BA929A3